MPGTRHRQVLFALGRHACTVIERAGLPPAERRATAAGGVAGTAVVGAVTLADAGSDGVARFAGLVGAESGAVGWVALFVLAVVFAAGFGTFLSRTANPFVAVLFGLTRRSEAVRRVLRPVVTGPAYAAAALTLGVVYGLAIGVGFGAVIMPAWVGALAGTTSAPSLDPVVVVAWGLYGAAVGVTYAILTDR